MSGGHKDRKRTAPSGVSPVVAMRIASRIRLIEVARIRPEKPFESAAAKMFGVVYEDDPRAAAPGRLEHALVAGRRLVRIHGETAALGESSSAACLECVDGNGGADMRRIPGGGRG